MTNETDRAFVVGWKGIAEFLGVHQDTAMEYERDRGLPVRRDRGPKSGVRVYASKAELNTWRLESAPLETEKKTA